MEWREILEKEADETQKVGKMFLKFIVENNIEVPRATAAMIDVAGACMGRLAGGEKVSKEEFQKGVEMTIQLLRHAAEASYEYWKKQS